MAFLEVACFNVESAIIAAHAGADRIELCRYRASGGTTPDFTAVIDLHPRVNIPIFVMIRPRPGSFIYTDREIETMRRDITLCKAFAAGFVFGVINQDDTINKEACAGLIGAAHPLPCTFHRAFDGTRSLPESLEILIECGFTSILTSVGAPDAVKGKQHLMELVQRAGNRINIIVGGGVRSTNFEQLSQIRPSAFHTAAIMDDGEIANAIEIQDIKRRLAALKSENTPEAPKQS